MLRVLIVALVLLPLFASGCFNKKPVDTMPCATGPATPLSVDEVRSAYRRVGIALHPYPEGCERTVVAYLKNTDPGGDPDVNEQIISAHGDVICGVQEKAVYGKSVKQSKEGRNRYIFDLQNLECSLYPDGASAETQIDRVAAVMHSLQR